MLKFNDKNKELVQQVMRKVKSKQKSKRGKRRRTGETGVASEKEVNSRKDDQVQIELSNSLKRILYEDWKMVNQKHFVSAKLVELASTQLTRHSS